jgi:adenylate cyclase
VLFAYVSAHLVNHALGNVSIGAMEAGLSVQKAIWQGTLGTTALYTSLGIHLTLGFWALYARHHFRWTRAEAVQLVLGFAVPLLLANHVLGTRLALSLFGTEKGYVHELYTFWVASPGLGVLQLVALVVPWIHGCLGIYFWLRLKSSFPKIGPPLLCLAVLVPTMALLGFFEAGKELLTLTADEPWRAANLKPAAFGSTVEQRQLAIARNAFLGLYVAAIGLVFFARWVRSRLERARGLLTLTYVDGHVVKMRRGMSVLDASIDHGLPHAHVCGGRGRCSTCRIRILGALEHLPPPSTAELAILKRLGTGRAVRLACQLRPESDLVIVPLVPPEVAWAHVLEISARRRSDERFVVAMFADMRGSTRIASSDCRSTRSLSSTGFSAP